MELPINRLPRTKREGEVPDDAPAAEKPLLAWPLLLAPEMRTDRIIEDEVRNAFAM